jgi:hypothetical protein
MRNAQGPQVDPGGRLPYHKFPFQIKSIETEEAAQRKKDPCRRSFRTGGVGKWQ